jgi:response regulator NasT
MRILIAEDETIIRLDVRTLLEKAGHEVVAEARDGQEAVALAEQHDPELIVMDVRMPHLDGIEAARQITDRKPVPIVMLTAYAEQDLVTRASEAGAFAYLVKPFREVDLLPALDTARARFEELSALRDEAADLAEALASRKAVERAKGILMQKDDIDEAEAFRRIRAASQKTGRTMRVVAEALIATFDEAAG